MLDPDSAVFPCSDRREILAAYNKIIRELSPDVRQRLTTVLQSYLPAFGVEGVCERFNGRSVSQILSEYREPVAPPVICSGERDGVRWSLHEARSHDGKAGGDDKSGD